MAVVAMVEPEIAEKTVPATTATTASRPGTCRTSRSTPSITFTASPVWNRTSPIRMKSGIGVSEKLATETTLFRASCVSPAWSPRKTRAPPAGRETAARWSLRASAMRRRPMTWRSAGRHGVITRRALPEVQAAHAEQHLQRKREERRRQDAEQPPLRRDQRLDRDRPGRVAGERRARPVVRDRRAAGEPERVGDPLERPAHAGR